MELECDDTNVNKRRGSRSKKYDSTPEFECLLLEEFREFKREIMQRLDLQSNSIKELQEICFSTRNELEELKINVRQLQGKFDEKHLSSTPNQPRQAVITKSSSTNQRAMAEIASNIEVPITTFAEATRKKTVKYNLNLVNKQTKDTSGATKSGVATLTAMEEQPYYQKPNHQLELHADEEAVNEWTTVRKKKSYQSKDILRGKNTEVVEIQGTERKKQLHVWRLTKETTIEKLTSHVKRICGPKEYVKIDKIKHKTERDYASFIITVTETMYNKLCQPELWPLNAELCEWIWFRRPKPKSIEEKQ